MNNEPVAWMAANELLFSVVKDEIYHIPLYTNPAKTLTDEEIEEVHNSQDFYNDWEMFSYKDFARAILRKAQEK